MSSGKFEANNHDELETRYFPNQSQSLHCVLQCI